jgi:hypothetical protein
VLLTEIEAITENDTSFKEYIERDGGQGQAGHVLDLITKALEIDGAGLSDYELLATIADISDLYKHYEARRNQE